MNVEAGRVLDETQNNVTVIHSTVGNGKSYDVIYGVVSCSRNPRTA